MSSYCSTYGAYITSSCFELAQYFIILLVQVLITVRDITPRTQWLLHYSFTPVTDPTLGLKMIGAIKSEESGVKTKSYINYSIVNRNLYRN